MKFVHLPAEGFTGRVPKFPLLSPSDREAEFWAELWGSPQASQWAKESWRIPTVGLYVRFFVRAEDPGAPATVAAQVSRLADQLGLTSAGLRQNGWVLAEEIRAVEPVAEGRVSAFERVRRRSETGQPSSLDLHRKAVEAERPKRRLRAPKEDA